jgi:hypothetical protein
MTVRWSVAVNLGRIPLHTIGLLPPPLAGEGWGGGTGEIPSCGCPLPVPPPHSASKARVNAPMLGEGTVAHEPSQIATGVLR